jgi:hypothetical protein
MKGGTMRKGGMLVAAAFLLSACDPQAVMGDVTERAARSVVVNVLVNQYARPQAEAAAECVIRNASAAEIDALARDVGTRAGTVTVATVRAVGDRPATQGCLTGQGLLPIAVVP